MHFDLYVSVIMFNISSTFTSTFNLLQTHNTTVKISLKTTGKLLTAAFS